MGHAREQELIELRFVGEGMSPARLRIGDLAEASDAIEALAQAAVLSVNTDVTKDDIHLALTKIQHGSALYGYETSRRDEVMPAYIKATELINNNRFDLLSVGVNRALNRIAKVAQKNNCTAELRTSLRTEPLAKVSAEVYVPEGARVRTRTTLYGRVTNAGGKTDPNVHLDTIQGYQVIFSGTEAQVRELGEYLYQMVGIVGVGYYNVVTQEYKDFSIQHVLPYKATPITKAFHELADAAPYFAGVDATEYVCDLRTEDDGED